MWDNIKGDAWVAFGRTQRKCEYQTLDFPSWNFDFVEVW